MGPKVLPPDAGVPFSPVQFERKEVPEEMRAINLWRRLRGKPAVANEEEKAKEMPEGESEPLGEPALQVEPILKAGARRQEQDVSSDVASKPDSQFQRMGKDSEEVEGSFEQLANSFRLGKDGIFSVVRAEERAAEEEEEQNAARERARLLAEAQSQAEQIRQQAKERGHQQGYSEGLTKAREEILGQLTPVVENFRKTIQELTKYRSEILRFAEKEIFELAVLIGKKVLHAELRIHPDSVLGVVRYALSRAVGWGRVTVYVHPDDCAIIEEQRGMLNEEAEGVILTRIEPSEGITRGGCRLESNFGEVDARLELQVDEIERALRDAFADKFLEGEASEDVEADASLAEPTPSAEAAPAVPSAPESGEPQLKQDEARQAQAYRLRELGDTSKSQENQE